MGSCTHCVADAAELARQRKGFDEAEAAREAADRARRQVEQAEAAAAHERSLEGLRAATEEVRVAEAARAKQERVELLRRQAGRRMLYARLASGWAAWAELWEARRYALGRLRDVGNTLRAPELTDAFGFWAHESAAAAAEARLVELARAQSELEGKLAEMDAANEAQHGSANAQAAALERQMAEARAQAAAEKAAMEAKAREERVELLRRQAGRRMLYARLASGWAAWAELWEARRYALGRLRDVGNQLRTPGLTDAFDVWAEDAQEVKRERETRAMLSKNMSLAGQLRAANYDLGQLTLLRAAHEDELRSLRHRVSEQASELREQEATLAGALAATRELADLQALYAEVKAELDDAMARAAASGSEVADQRQASEALLRTLLDEQRKSFEVEAAGLRERLAAKTEAQKREARIEVLRQTAMRRLKNAAIARAWGAWEAWWEAHVASKATLLQASARLTRPALSATFQFWRGSWQAYERALRSMTSEEQLALKDAERASVERDLDRARAEIVAVSAARDDLARKVRQLSGDDDEARAMLAEQAVEERARRIETFGRQAGRRMMHGELRRGWTAWLERYEAHRFAWDRLERTARRLRGAMTRGSFEAWRDAVEDALVGATVSQLRRSEARLAEEVDDLRTSLEALRSEQERSRLAFDEEKQLALTRQRVELVGSVAEREAMMAERAREEHVELLRRQAGRRMLYAGLADAFEAWVDLWEAKAYALGRLRQAGSRLRAPALGVAFGVWASVLDAKREAEAYEAMSDLQRKEVRPRPHPPASPAPPPHHRFLLRPHSVHRPTRPVSPACLPTPLLPPPAHPPARPPPHRPVSLACLPAPPLLRSRDPTAPLQVDLLNEVERWRREAERWQQEASLAAQRAEDDKALALERQLTELTGSAAEIAALRETEAKEARVELLRRQVGRRMMSSGLSRGWTAWMELYDARRYALTRLRECGQRLRAPELAVAFAGWAADVEAERQAKALRELEESTKSLEAQLRCGRPVLGAPIWHMGRRAGVWHAETGGKTRT